MPISNLNDAKYCPGSKAKKHHQSLFFHTLTFLRINSAPKTTILVSFYRQNDGKMKQVKIFSSIH